jgi:MFS family permease
MRRALAPLLDLSRAERLVVLAFWVVGVAQGFAQSHAANTLPFTRVTFGLTEGEMAGVMALTRIGAFSAILVSFISDRSGRRNLFVGTLALMVAAAGATGWVVDAEQFTIAQGVMRAASTAAGVLAVVMLAELLPAGSRAIGMGIYAAAASLGAGLSVLLLPLAEAGPEEWRLLFQYALIGFVAIPVALRWIPEPPKPSGPRRRYAIWRPLASPYAAHFWPLAVSSLLFAAFTTTQVTFASERLINDLGNPASVIVALSLTGGTLGGLGYFIGGHLADTRGRRIVTMVGFAIAAVGGVGLYWTETLPLLWFSVFLAAFGAFAAAPATSAHRNELFPQQIRASAVAWLAAFTVSGTIGGLWVGNWAIDDIGLPMTVLLLGAGMLIAIGVTAALPETKAHPEFAEEAPEPA